MVRVDSRGRTGMFEYQPPALLNQAAPVQNTWYTILDTTAYVKVYMIGAGVLVANETLEVQATVDGEVIEAVAQAVVINTEMYAALDHDVFLQRDELVLNTLGQQRGGRGEEFEGLSVKIEMRKTTALGAGNLVGIVIYGVLTPIY